MLRYNAKLLIKAFLRIAIIQTASMWLWLYKQHLGGRLVRSAIFIYEESIGHYHYIHRIKKEEYKLLYREAKNYDTVPLFRTFNQLLSQRLRQEGKWEKFYQNHLAGFDRYSLIQSNTGWEYFINALKYIERRSNEKSPRINKKGKKHPA